MFPVDVIFPTRIVRLIAGGDEPAHTSIPYRSASIISTATVSLDSWETDLRLRQAREQLIWFGIYRLTAGVTSLRAIAVLDGDAGC